MTRHVWSGLVVVAASVALLAASQQEAPQAATGVIAGRVLDAQTGQPLAGIVLQIGPGAPAAGAGRPARVVSDSQGRFVFSSLTKGSYLIPATAGGNGYAPNGFVVTGMGFPIGAYLNGGFGQRRPNGPLRPIELSDGQKVTDAEIRLWKSAVVSGRVVDETGEPLVGAVVGIVQLSSEGRLLNGPTMRTDDLGAYRFSGLSPGNHVVFVPQVQVSMPTAIADELVSSAPDPTARQRFSAASAPPPTVGGLKIGESLVSTVPDSGNFASGTFSNALPPIARGDALFVYQTTFHPSVIALSQSTRIKLLPGEGRENVDVQLHPTAAASVSGVVVDDAGPVAGLGLRLMPADQGEEASILEATHTASDSRGAFVFPVVPAGNYNLVAWRTSGVPTGNQQQPFAEPRRISEHSGAWAIQPVAVGARAVENVRVTVRAPVTVNGRVEFSGASPRPSAERLRTGFMTTIWRANAMLRTSGSSSGSLMDPATGRISVKGVSPPGRYFAGPPSLPAPWSVESMTLAGQDVTDAAFNIGDADLNDLVITYTDRPASITGSVSGAAAEATVFMVPVNRARWPDARLSSRTFRSARPSTAGTYVFTNVPPGDYFIVAIRDEDAGDWPDASFLARLAAAATAVKVTPSQQVSFTLKVGVLK